MQKRAAAVVFILFLIFSQSCPVSRSDEVSCSDEVKFEGTVLSEEKWGEIVCYGSYYVEVRSIDILMDRSRLLSEDNTYVVAYPENLGLEVGDEILVYGMAWFGPYAPKQCHGRIQAKGDNYYVQLLQENIKEREQKNIKGREISLTQIMIIITVVIIILALTASIWWVKER